MAEYTLHCFAQSGNAYKVALMLALPAPTGSRSSSTSSTAPPARPSFCELNQMGEVPVLEHGELVLTQSGVILDYLAAALPRLRADAPRTSAARSCAGRSGTTTSSPATIAPLRFLMKFVPEEKPDQGVIAWLGKRAGNALKVLDRHLFTQEWVAADRVDHRRPLLRRLSLLRPRVRPRPRRLPEHRALAPGDRRAARLEASLRPDARPPDPGRGPHMTDAYIYDAIRTPRGKGRPDGSLHEVTALRLSADTLNALRARNGGAADAVEDVIWGNVTQVGEQGGCLARSAVLALRPRPRRSPASRSTASAPPASRR